MLRGTTVGDLVRREAVLATFLATAAAFFTLAALLGFAWMAIVGGAVALAGAAVRVAIVAQRSRVERQREDTRLARRTRVPIAPVSGVDPTAVGVDAAARAIDAGEDVPRYLPRQIDAELRAAIQAALDGTGPRIVVVVGRSKVGKSRALFEALRACEAGAALDFVAPTDGAALDSMLMPGERAAVAGECAVLWLDDLEPFVNEGVTLQTLLEWLSLAPGKGVVVATYGGKGSDLVQGSSVALGTTAREIVQRAHRIALEATTAQELVPLRPQLSERAAESIERHGLAAHLVAATELELKLASRRHAIGEPESPEGMAVVEAAVDWARCGRTDPLPEEVLRERLWPAYLPPGVRASAAAFEAGVEWAVRPVAGSISLVEDDGGFQAYDYAVDLTASDPVAVEPKAEAWACAIDGANDAQALSVGYNAYVAGRLTDAVEAFRVATRSPLAVNAAIAGMNLGLVLAELDRAEEEIAAYDQVLASYADLGEPLLRETIAGVLIAKGNALRGSGRAEESLDRFDEVITRFGPVDDPTVELRERLAAAMINKGGALSELDRPEEALASHDDALARLGDPGEPPLQLLVAKALITKGAQLAELRSEGDLAAYEQVISRYGGASDPALRVVVATALHDKALALRERGQLGAATLVCEEVLRRHPDPEDPELRALVAGALIEKAANLRRTGRGEEAVPIYDEVLERFAEDEEPDSLRRRAAAQIEKGVALGDCGSFEAELACYDEVVAAFGGAEDVGIRRQIVRALFAKASRLSELERLEEAIPLFREVRARIGDSRRLAQLAASALLNEGILLARLDGREAEAIAALDELVERQGDSDDPTMREAVALARETRRGMGESRG